MKALTIREPYASLIKNQIKHYETRSFKTKYRGELYIHAGKAKVTNSTFKNKDDLKDICKNINYQYGKIIIKCILKDCIYMDEQFIKTIKKNHKEYICGEYTIGRYAWLLDNIEIIDPIEINGQLGLWNYNK